MLDVFQRSGSVPCLGGARAGLICCGALTGGAGLVKVELSPAK